MTFVLLLFQLINYKIFRKVSLNESGSFVRRTWKIPRIKTIDNGTNITHPDPTR